MLMSFTGLRTGWARRDFSQEKILIQTDKKWRLPSCQTASRIDLYLGIYRSTASRMGCASVLGYSVHALLVPKSQDLVTTPSLQLLP